MDRIWGLLGLLDPAERSSITENGWVDYSEKGRKEYWQTYVRVVRWLLEYPDPTLNLLSLAPSKERHPNVPSWCPDWNYLQECDPFVGDNYRAGYGTDFPQTRIFPVPEPECLKICGFQIDKIDEVTEPLSRPTTAGLDRQKLARMVF